MMYFLFLKGILNGADIMRLEDVRNECVKFLMQIMCDETCLMIKYIADARMIVPLSEKCLNNALKRFKLVEVSYLIFMHRCKLLKSIKGDKICVGK